MIQESTSAQPPKIEKDVAKILMPDEHHIMTVHQHIFILLKYYFFAIIACSLFFVSAIVLFNTSVSLDSSKTQVALLSVGVLTTLVFVIITYVISMAYKLTALVITNHSVLQILQSGLILHKVSRLSMADVEDVASEQGGILARIIGFGSLTIQTAGEQPNFIFKYCPKPTAITEIILKARQQYIETGE